LFPRGPARKLWARGVGEGRRKKVSLARFLGLGRLLVASRGRGAALVCFLPRGVRGHYDHEDGVRLVSCCCAVESDPCYSSI
jgi:hypothetical protein